MGDENESRTVRTAKEIGAVADAIVRYERWRSRMLELQKENKYRRRRRKKSEEVQVEEPEWKLSSEL